MALSGIQAQARTYKGQGYIFVGQLEDHLKELECPIYHGIVSDPLQPTCGYLFCRECHGKLRVTRTDMPSV